MTLHDDGTLKSLIYTSQRHGPNFVTYWPIVMSSRPNCKDQSVWCVASTLTLDAGTDLEFVPLLSCAVFVYFQCTERWLVFNNTHIKDGIALYSHYPCSFIPPLVPIA